MATATLSPRLTTWRENFKVTRSAVFSIVFILLGVVMLSNIPNNIPEGATTTLTWGDPRLNDLVLLTRDYGIIVALLYVLGGIFALIPLPERLHWIKTAWLILNGILIIPTALILTTVNGSANMTQTLESSFRLMTPIAIGSLAGLWCERSGVVNVAIEGMMLTGACFGFIAFVMLMPYMATPNAQLIGVLVAIFAGGVMALLHAWLSITFQTDQVVSGTVINILAVGITSFMRREVLLSNRAARETLGVVEIPLLSEIPVIGRVLFTGKPIFLSMFVLVILSHIVLFYTRWGLRTRAVGENPHAADTLGIEVLKNRYINVIIGGMIAGFAGAWFSLETVGNFDDGMTRGLGFIALAALVFGKWLPFGAFTGALLFGFSSALNARFQIQGVNIPAQFIQMTPYIVTIIVLAGLVGRAIGPKASGTPYKKE